MSKPKKKVDLKQEVRLLVEEEVRGIFGPITHSVNVLIMEVRRMMEQSHAETADLVQAGVGTQQILQALSDVIITFGLEAQKKQKLKAVKAASKRRSKK